MEQSSLLLQKVGNCHFYQWRILLLVSLFYFSTSPILFVTVYFTKFPQVVFFDSSSFVFKQDNFNYSFCSNRFEMIDYPFSTWLNFFPEIICDPFKVGLFSTFGIAGYIIGSFFSNVIGDSIGKTKCFLIAGLSCSLGFFCMCFTNSYEMVLVVLLIGNTFGTLAHPIQTPYLFENISVDLRDTFSAVNNINYGLTTFCFLFLHYYSQSLTLVVAFYGCLSFVFTILLFCFAYESPAYYIISGNSKMYLSTLERIAVINGKTKELKASLGDDPDSSLLGDNEFSDFLNMIDEKKESNTFFQNGWKLLKYESLRQNYLLVISLGVMLNFIYYGGAFFFKNLEGNYYIIAGSMCVLETVSYSCGPILTYFPNLGRRHTYYGGFIIICLGYTLDFFVKSAFTNAAASFVNRFVSSFLYMVLFSVIAEIFPTKVRATGSSHCLSIAKIGAIVAGQLVEVFQNYNSLMNIIICALSIGIIVRLKETRGAELSDYIEEEMGDEKDTLRRVLTDK